MGADVTLNYREAEKLAELIDIRALELIAHAKKIETDVADAISGCWTEGGGDLDPCLLVSEGVRSRVRNLEEAGKTLSNIAHAMDRTATAYKIAEDKKAAASAS